MNDRKASLSLEASSIHKIFVAADRWYHQPMVFSMARPNWLDIVDSIITHHQFTSGLFHFPTIQTCMGEGPGHLLNAVFAWNFVDLVS